MGGIVDKIGLIYSDIEMDQTDFDFVNGKRSTFFMYFDEWEKTDYGVFFAVPCPNWRYSFGLT